MAHKKTTVRGVVALPERNLGEWLERADHLEEEMTRRRLTDRNEWRRRVVGHHQRLVVADVRQPEVQYAVAANIQDILLSCLTE